MEEEEAVVMVEEVVLLDCGEQTTGMRRDHTPSSGRLCGEMSRMLRVWSGDSILAGRACALSEVGLGRGIRWLGRVSRVFFVPCLFSGRVYIAGDVDRFEVPVLCSWGASCVSQRCWCV